MECNGKFYPLWGQFVAKSNEFAGGTLEDLGDQMDRAILKKISRDNGTEITFDTMKTKIVRINLRPNGVDSAFFEVIGEKFTCGFDVKHGGVTAGDPGYITFSGYQDHRWRIKGPEVTNGAHSYTEGSELN